MEKVTQASGLSFSMLACDQKLFRVMNDVIWANPPQWNRFVPRIGGIHWLMSFVGSMRKLMDNSGVENLMGSSFAWVEKILAGKKFPMNVRVLRLVVVKLWRSHMDNKSE